MHEILFLNGCMDHLTHSNATNSWLFLLWITNWAMEPFTIWKSTLISKMQETTTTKTTIKDQIIEKNVMPKK
jgi:hypothetical protein